MKKYLSAFALTPETFWIYVIIFAAILIYGKVNGWQLFKTSNYNEHCDGIIKPSDWNEDHRQFKQDFRANTPETNFDDEKPK